METLTSIIELIYKMGEFLVFGFGDAWAKIISALFDAVGLALSESGVGMLTLVFTLIGIYFFAHIVIFGLYRMSFLKEMAYDDIGVGRPSY